MAETYTIQTVLLEDDNTTATNCIIPENVVSALQARGRVPVRGTINGSPFRSSIFPYGGTYYLLVTRVIREAANVKAGDPIEVAFQRDEEPRVVTPPDDLVAALEGSEAAQQAWERLPYSHQKEYVQAIEEAKKPETRARRLEKALEEMIAWAEKSRAKTGG